MTADQPSPPQSHLKVVSLLDRSGLAARLSQQPQALVASFMPIADLGRGDIAGYEVLLSLEAEGPQSPCAWSQGVHPRQAGVVEAPMLSAALRALDAIPEERFLAIALSGHGLLSEEVAAVFAAAGRLERVVVIVSEGAQTEDELALRRALQTVREAGATVAVDETASGYASLKHVLRLRPDFVRVGPDFVVEVDHDPAKAAVVESLASLASRIGATVIAGGIPGAAELEALRRMGIPLGQGPMLGAATNEIAPLSDRAARVIRESSARADGEPTVAGIVESRPPLRWGAAIDELADAFLDDPRHDVLVLVDERSRPLALAERAALLRGEPFERPVMRITPSSPLKAVARRAAARPALERFHPLVVCDRRGVYLGVVRVEQLLDMLAR